MTGVLSDFLVFKYFSLLSLLRWRGNDVPSGEAEATIYSNFILASQSFYLSLTFRSHLLQWGWTDIPLEEVGSWRTSSVPNAFETSGRK